MITLPPESPTHTTTTTTTNTNPVSHFIQTTLSYDSNVMLAAIISLLVVILFVLLLHIYARWFLVQARQRSRSSVTVPHVLGSRFHRFTITDVDTIHDHSSPSKGLHPSFISSLPLFVYQYSPAEDNDVINSQGTLECAICISLFEEDEVGRRLPKCGHAFHVECIDMWLDSHSTCPICRAAIVCELPTKMDTDTDSDRDHGSLPEIEICPNARSENNHEMFNNAANVPVENHDDAGIRLLETSLGESLRRMLSSSRVERKAHVDHNNVVTHESEV